MKNKHTAFLFLTSCALCVAGESFEISRFTIDSGGILRSTGGSFELSGTVGQPDAGTLTGDAFQLSGGFWFEVPPGDCDESGNPDLLDHLLFAECLVGPDGGVLSGCDCNDVDLSGSVDLRDFAIITAGY